VLHAGSRELSSTAALDDDEPGGRTAPLWRYSRWPRAGGARDLRPAGGVSLPAQSSSPAVDLDVHGARKDLESGGLDDLNDLACADLDRFAQESTLPIARLLPRSIELPPAHLELVDPPAPEQSDRSP
jgi:hypothetical protein